MQRVHALEDELGDVNSELQRRIHQLYRTIDWTRARALKVWQVCNGNLSDSLSAFLTNPTLTARRRGAPVCAMSHSLHALCSATPLQTVWRRKCFLLLYSMFSIQIGFLQVYCQACVRDRLMTTASSSPARVCKECYDLVNMFAFGACCRWLPNGFRIRCSFDSTRI